MGLKILLVGTKTCQAFLNLDLNSNSLGAGFNRYVDSREKFGERNIQYICNIRLCMGRQNLVQAKTGKWRNELLEDNMRWYCHRVKNQFQ